MDCSSSSRDMVQPWHRICPRDTRFTVVSGMQREPSRVMVEVGVDNLAMPIPPETKKASRLLPVWVSVS